MQNPGRKMRRGKEEVCVLEIVRPGDGRFRICRKTGKYRDRTSQRAPRQKRVHAEARRDEGVCVVGGRETGMTNDRRYRVSRMRRSASASEAVHR